MDHEKGNEKSKKGFLNIWYLNRKAKNRKSVDDSYGGV